MARSDAEQLAFYLDLRDAIEDGINAAAGRSMMSFTIRQRTVTYESALKWLEFVNAQIEVYRVRTQTDGSTRNRIRLTK